MDTQEKEKEQEENTDNPHDKGYKRIFSIKRNFLDFIKKYIGFDWMMGLTEDDLELIDKEYVTDQFDTYESDLVYKVNTKAGSIYLFFLFEFQSYNDFTMPFRLLVYMTAIWLDYFKNSDKNKRKQKGYRLPAIMPIVLHNGERSWTASHRFREMIRQEDLFGKYVVDFEYVLVSVKRLTASQIKSSNTLVDNILLADKKNTRKAWNSTNSIELVRRIRAMEKNDLNEWITWFSKVVRELGEEERKEFIQQLREGDEKNVCSSFERIIKKERVEGEVKGTAKCVIELLEYIGEPSETLRKKIMSQTDIEKLRVWHRAAARAKTIEEFEQAIGLVQT
ncbi:MAG: Rpn family recombination-promoting nuclease/putative transposase [Lachnospiraceae bacterium]|nr:Rpn family recombination-promoting nuclease/putative transposase [Lachnospiraceae bacterium]